MLSEYRSIEQDVGDVTENVILHLDFIRIAENRDTHRFRSLVFRIVHTSHARDDPDEILVAKILAHQLRHDTKATNLDLDCPVFDIVLHGSNKNHTTVCAFVGEH